MNQRQKLKLQRLNADIEKLRLQCFELSQKHKEIYSKENVLKFQIKHKLSDEKLKEILEEHLNILLLRSQGKSQMISDIKYDETKDDYQTYVDLKNVEHQKRIKVH